VRTTLLSELVGPDGLLDPERWVVAHRDRTPVALCGCRGLVVTNPEEPAVRTVFGVPWHAMRCTVCGHETEVTGNRRFPNVARTSLQVLEAARELEARKLADA
jgi:hypothetical protein